MSSGRVLLYASTGLTTLVAIASAALAITTLEIRYERDVSRMVFNDNVELLDELHRRAGSDADSLRLLLELRVGKLLKPLFGRLQD